MPYAREYLVADLKTEKVKQVCNVVVYEGSVPEPAPISHIMMVPKEEESENSVQQATMEEDKNWKYISTPFREATPTSAPAIRLTIKILARVPKSLMVPNPPLNTTPTPSTN